MEANEQKRFDTLYAQHLRALKLRGYSASTIDDYGYFPTVVITYSTADCVHISPANDLHEGRAKRSPSLCFG